jgi:hypothetical protein
LKESWFFSDVSKIIQPKIYCQYWIRNLLPVFCLYEKFTLDEKKPMYMSGKGPLNKLYLMKSTCMVGKQSNS